MPRCPPCRSPTLPDLPDFLTAQIYTCPGVPLSNLLQPTSPTLPDLHPGQISPCSDLSPAQVIPLTDLPLPKSPPCPGDQGGTWSPFTDPGDPKSCCKGRCLLRFWGQNRRRPQTRRAPTSQSAPVQGRCVSPACCGRNSHPALPASSSFPVNTEFSSKQEFFRCIINHQLVLLLAWVWLCQARNSKFTRIWAVAAAPTWEGTFLGGSMRMEGSHSPGGSTVT